MCKVGTTFSFLKRSVFCHNRWHVLHLLQNTLRFTIETILYVFEMLIFQPGNTCFLKKTMLSPLENNHFHNPCITHIAFLFRNPLFYFLSLNIYFRSLSDPWAILERSLSEIHINTMKPHHCYPNDRSRIAHGSPEDRFQWSQGSILSEL